MFQQLLDARIKDLWNFYELTGELSHQGEKGFLREAFLKSLLETVLPIQFGVGSGLIVDKWNRQSAQTDLIIYDKRLLPPLLEHSSHGIYPMDSVLKTIEVKSTLDKDGLTQFKRAAWLLNPKNPDGLKLASAGNLADGYSYYPMSGLYAYDARLADISASATEIDIFSGDLSVLCVATRGLYMGPQLRQTVFNPASPEQLLGSDIVYNTRCFLAVFLQSLEAVSASRQSFSLMEWLLAPGR